MVTEDVEISKFLSYVLRHAPESAGLQMDGGGWVPVAGILAANARIFGETHLRGLVRDSGKQRFALSEDGQFIRALQGHSVKVDLGLVAQEPPEHLFHGTADRFLDAIMVQGVLRMQRQYVHLSMDVATAAEVGQRHGRPVVLQVAAGAMHRDGLTFWLSENRVWLTEGVAPSYLSRL